MIAVVCSANNFFARSEKRLCNTVVCAEFTACNDSDGLRISEMRVISLIAICLWDFIAADAAPRIAMIAIVGTVKE